MAFFKLSKKKTEQPLDMPMPSQETQMQPTQTQNSPIEQVLMMKQQGYTNNQIVQTLQSQGYSTNQIFDAINQAGLSTFQATPEAEQPEAGMPEYGQGYEQQYQQQQSFQTFQAPREIQPPASLDEERIQEVAEAIIDEKWEELAKDIRKIIEWKERSEDRLAKLEQQMIDMRLSIDSLAKSIMNKVSAYDQNIMDVGTEIKAMEKVFQKVLPNLTESVNKLDRMTKGYNKETQQQKK